MKLKQSQLDDENSFDEEGGAECFVLGGERLGASIARRLQTDGHAVTLVDETHDPAEVPSVHGDPSDPQVLEDAGVSRGSTVVVTTPRDGQNLLIAQLLRARFGVSEVLVLVNAPDRYDLVAEVGHEPVCATTVLSEMLVEGLKEMNADLSHTA